MLPAVSIERDVAIGACAISAGIHAALVTGHFDESVGAGSGFAAATVLLAALAAVLIWRPGDVVAVAAAGCVLAGLLASYLLAVTSGLPLLHPEPESIGGLALATKAIEAVGLLAALRSIGRRRAAAPSAVLNSKGVRT